MSSSMSSSPASSPSLSPFPRAPRAHPRPRPPPPPSPLPQELWDEIIDLVAISTPSLSLSPRRDIIACCSVCRAFVPRCRSHLKAPRQLTVQSRAQLEEVARTLSTALGNRLEELAIDAGHDADQSWVSTVPFRLPRSISKLVMLFLSGVDLSVLHPQALQAFSHIHILQVHLRDVRYSSYTQLTRFFSISTRVIVSDLPAMTHEVAPLRRLPPSPRQGLRQFELSGLSWATLSSMTESLDLSTCTGAWFLHFEIDGPSSEATSTIGLVNIRRGFEQICGQSERALKFNISLKLAQCSVGLQWYSDLLI